MWSSLWRPLAAIDRILPAILEVYNVTLLGCLHGECSLCFIEEESFTHTLKNAS